MADEPRPDLIDLIAQEAARAAPVGDPAWVSALRGRLSAALAAIVALGTAGLSWWERAEALMADGLTAAEALEVLAHSGVVLESGEAALIAGGLAWAALTAGAAKAFPCHQVVRFLDENFVLYPCEANEK
jgi:hypothetical protein